ncbi:hypothetical protein LX92_00040 [Maribacter polysiphoniae]|uniref:Uncharacterized protein n=1 Tax=Maribacter polysiphoniae TaxID=429344 RepID=A0A316E4I0_9FLAO|nr:hypothetical protein LX92_00040 [Maribacter polysiphoniae]
MRYIGVSRWEYGVLVKSFFVWYKKSSPSSRRKTAHFILLNYFRPMVLFAYFANSLPESSFYILY